MDSSKRAQNARKELPGSSKQKINRTLPRCNETSANCSANLSDNNKKAETELEISRLQCDALRAVADKWQLELEELRLFSKEELNSKPDSGVGDATLIRKELAQAKSENALLSGLICGRSGRNILRPGVSALKAVLIADSII